MGKVWWEIPSLPPLTRLPGAHSACSRQGFSRTVFWFSGGKIQLGLVAQAVFRRR